MVSRGSHESITKCIVIAQEPPSETWNRKCTNDKNMC